MKKYIISAFITLLFASCQLRENYICSCEEIYNTEAQRNFGYTTYDNAKEKDVVNNCESKEVELNAIYKDSLMRNNQFHNDSSAVTEIHCGVRPGA